MGSPPREVIEIIQRSGGNLLGWGPDVVVSIPGVHLRENFILEMQTIGWLVNDNESDLSAGILHFSKTAPPKDFFLEDSRYGILKAAKMLSVGFIGLPTLIFLFLLHTNGEAKFEVLGFIAIYFVLMALISLSYRRTVITTEEISSVSVRTFFRLRKISISNVANFSLQEVKSRKWPITMLLLWGGDGTLLLKVRTERSKAVAGVLSHLGVREKPIQGRTSVF